jgi:hypothetical protein
MGLQRDDRREGWLVLSSLVGAGLALPLAQSTWHGPEVAATLAVAAITLLAGQRWAIAVIVLSDLFLLPTVLPRVVVGPGWLARLIAVATLLAIVPGLRAMPRAAIVLARMAGPTGTERMYRCTHLALRAIGMFAAIVKR